MKQILIKLILLFLFLACKSQESSSTYPQSYTDKPKAGSETEAHTHVSSRAQLPESDDFDRYDSAGHWWDTHR